MLRAPSPQQYQFETIPLDELVPEDHLVRQIDTVIDFEFIRDAVAHLYCPNNGRPPLIRY
ncbi:IS5/IS1182 family transposase, partial [Escherichia coli]